MIFKMKIALALVLFAVNAAATWYVLGLDQESVGGWPTGTVAALVTLVLFIPLGILIVHLVENPPRKVDG